MDERRSDAGEKPGTGPGEPVPPPSEPAPPANEPAPPPSEPAGAPEPWSGASAAPPLPPATHVGSSPSPAGPGGLDRGPLVAGIVLVVIGLAFLAGRVVTVELGVETWPLWVVVPGIAMLIGSVFIPDRGGVALAIPGGIVTMVGLVLWVQAATDLYATWAYAWALVAPGGVGVGMFLFGLLRGYRDILANGLRTILVAIGLFLGFAFFFEAVIGLSGDRIADLDTILPVALVVLGVIVLAMAFVPRRRNASG